MPDYSSSSAGSRAISGTSGNSGISYEAAVNLEDEQYNILIQALTPTKATGVRAPSNTPSAMAPGSKIGVSPDANESKGKEQGNEETPRKIIKEVLVADKRMEEDAASSIS